MPSQSQFWIIDTDSPGMSEGQHSASGPYPTLKAAEAAILADHRALWESSCQCLQSNSTTPWSKPIHIVERRRTVIPHITPKITLQDVE